MDAKNNALKIVAKITNPASFSYITEFPGLAAFELHADSPAEKKTADAIIYAIQAGKFWTEHGDNSAAFGKLEAMLQYELTTIERIYQALLAYRNTKIPEQFKKC